MAIALDGTGIEAGVTTGNLVLNSVPVTNGNPVVVTVQIRDMDISLSASDSNSYTWTEEFDVDNARGQDGVHIFHAVATNTGTTNITITATGNTKTLQGHAYGS